MVPGPAREDKARRRVRGPRAGAAYLFNGNRPARLYGAVTTGSEWKLVSFEAEWKLVQVDRDSYFETELPRLLGAPRYIVETTLAALGSVRSLARGRRSAWPTGGGAGWPREASRVRFCGLDGVPAIVV